MAKRKVRTNNGTEDILTLLEDLGTVPETLREKITSQTDDDILRKWLKLAARAESIEAFEENM